MKNSKKLIDDACRGVRPERTPIFDLLANDAVLEHFGEHSLDGSADEETVLRAMSCALDGSRVIFLPDTEGRTWTDEVGNIHVAARWTSWIKDHALTDEAQWKVWVEEHIEHLEAESFPDVSERAKVAADQREFDAKLNGTVYIHCTPCTAIFEALFIYHCGLEIFSYLWVDYPELILRWLRAIERTNLINIELNAHAENCGLAMVYSDIAYRQRMMFSKQMLNQLGFFDDVAQICEACHAKGLQVIFHSDGYVMDVMDDLIAAGIDGLNPIEKAAGMDIYELRRRYPELILVGGVDVTHLLVSGSPDDVRKETRRIINEVGAEGRLLIGSSTELGNDVPLPNYLAFHDEVLNG
jgi:hypothetical protein